MRKLLVIDDNREIAELVCATAGTLHFDCVAVASAQEFFSALTPEISLILIDMRMPDISGRELLGLLAERHCAAAIILMSGSGDEELAEAGSYGRSLGLDVIGMLAKPFRVAELATMLRVGA